MSNAHSVYFDADSLPEPQNQYVCWIDLMGIQSKLLQSMPQCANALYKFHQTLCEVDVDGDLDRYAIMDGAYVMSDRRDTMESFLDKVFRKLAELVTGELVSDDETEADSEGITIQGIHHAILPRAGLAFGPMVHGKDFSEEVLEGLDDHREHMEQIPMGMPMVQANQSERHAPPFGTYVDESARAFSPLKQVALRDGEGVPSDLAVDDSHHVERLRYVWHDWHRDIPSESDLLLQLTQILEEYFRYALKNHHRIPAYSPEDILRHAQQSAQYFEEIDYEGISKSGRKWS